MHRRRRRRAQRRQPWGRQPQQRGGGSDRAAAAGGVRASARVSEAHGERALMLVVVEGGREGGEHDRPYNDTLIGSTTPAGEVHVTTMK